MIFLKASYSKATGFRLGMADDRWFADWFVDDPLCHYRGLQYAPYQSASDASPFDGFLLFPSEKLWLQGFVAILFVAVAMLLFARYLMGPKHQLGVSAATDKVKHILNTYGGNSDSHLVYLKDKQVYVYPEIGEPTVFFNLRPLIINA